MYKKIREISKLPISSYSHYTLSHPDHFLGTEALMKDKPVIVGHENLNRSLINNFEFYKALQFNLTKDASLEEATKLILAEQICKKKMKR